jgi:hypothetical protein
MGDGRKANLRADFEVFSVRDAMRTPATVCRRLHIRYRWEATSRTIKSSSGKTVAAVALLKTAEAEVVLEEEDEPEDGGGEEEGVDAVQQSPSTDEYWKQ